MIAIIYHSGKSDAIAKLKSMYGNNILYVNLNSKINSVYLLRDRNLATVFVEEDISQELAPALNTALVEATASLSLTAEILGVQPGSLVHHLRPLNQHQQLPINKGIKQDFHVGKFAAWMTDATK